jgi:hypothetical protein
MIALVPLLFAPFLLAPHLLVPVLLLLGQPAIEPVPGLPADFPTKIWVQETLRPVVSEMWTTSATFRRQCLQVQTAPAIQVQLRIDYALATNSQHLAISELRSYSNGSLIARVSLAPMRLPELIGHEMEHICERLEGIHVDRESHQHHTGYYASENPRPRYESDRAIRVGRQVMAEMNIASTLTRTQP